MPTLDRRRDPPYFAVLLRTPPVGSDAGQFLDAGERMIGLAAAEPGFLGIEELIDAEDTRYTVCYWDRPRALRRWREAAAEQVPPKIDTGAIVCFEGCLWHWLTDVFDAVARVQRDDIIRVQRDDIIRVQRDDRVPLEQENVVTIGRGEAAA